MKDPKFKVGQNVILKCRLDYMKPFNGLTTITHVEFVASCITEDNRLLKDVYVYRTAATMKICILEDSIVGVFEPSPFLTYGEMIKQIKSMA